MRGAGQLGAIMRSRSVRAKLLFVILSTVHCLGCQQPGPATVQVNGVKNVMQDGDLFIAGAPTAEGLSEMKRQGVRTVIDFRGEDEGVAEERQAAAALGLDYIHIPMKPDSMSPEQVSALTKAMGKHRNQKVLMHCAGGNRAAAMYGAYLQDSGQCSPEQAVDRAKRAGMTNPKTEAALRGCFAPATGSRK
jgi:uncharacterized protein (TIGR01244 family)